MPENNHPYIDANNLHKGIVSLGWKLDYRKFRRFLTERHGVRKAYLCIGFIPTNAGLYRDLQSWGYILIFKPTVAFKGKIKGNCDGELIMQVMSELLPGSENTCDNVVLVSGDGDFASLVNFLEARGKLRILLSPVRAQCSTLLKKATPSITFLEEMRSKLEFIPDTE